MSISGVVHGDIVSEILHEEGKALLIDVREPAEYRSEHVMGSINVPISGIVDWAKEHREEIASHREVYLLCQGGVRAARAREELRGNGFDNMFCVEGGINRWKELGLATELGPFTLPLDRQMRVAAGSMAFIGTALAVAVNEWWLVLPGIVGAGLVYSGITGNCGVMKLMAMMPWNR